ncbi:MAG: DUF99 family protein [archaeon]
MKKFRQIKRELRILGIDDSPHKEHGKGTVLLVGTVFRGGEWLDGVLSRKIRVDGMDSTRKIIQMINETRHNAQLRVAMLDGITFGGMNTADISKIYKETGLPVIVVNRKAPDLKKMEKALDKCTNKNARKRCIEHAGAIQKVTAGKHNLYIQVSGINVEDATEILKISCTRGNLPEPLRTSHLIARGVTLGESRGRA